jgi:hypothetical protein
VMTGSRCSTILARFSSSAALLAASRSSENAKPSSDLAFGSVSLLSFFVLLPPLLQILPYLVAVSWRLGRLRSRVVYAGSAGLTAGP